MSVLQKISRSYKRWRHGRGFGIHSPFAYTFITEVLRQPYAYYAYSVLDGRQRLVFRIALYFRPATVALVGAESYATAVRAAMPSVCFTDIASADMLIVNEALRASALDNFGGRCAIAFDAARNEAWQCYNASLECGMTFDNNSDIAVTAVLPHLPRQSFSVKF